MAIQMQKSWTVEVKSKSAAFKQRFIISGADTGNGIYEYKGTNDPPPILVSGENWRIRIQNKPPGKPWVDSDDQITLPVRSGGLIKFDIQSNDAGSDEDFNDLILTCSTPELASDFILYGHASCYSGKCLLNPCQKSYVVVDTLDAFRTVIDNPLLGSAIKELYPERVKLAKRFPIPEPDPAPFRPVVLPLRNATALPPRQGQLVRTVTADVTAKAKMKAPSVQTAGRAVSIANQAEKAVAYDRTAVADLAGKLKLRCRVDDLPGFVLRFSEYDRTEAELSGGAYSGDGSREALGMAVTDRNGNYIFRFSRTAAEFVSEAIDDTAAGEDQLVQAMPDIIAELLDSTAPDGVAHESAPYWNIPSPLKRINICIPCSKVRRPVTECTGSHRFESVGRIRIGIPENSLDASGRITATDSSGNVPQARCAAWERTLDLHGCLGDHETVKYYTVRYRRYLSETGWSSWEFYQEKFKLFKTSIMQNASIGPFDHDLEVVNGGTLESVKAYNNVQGDYDWATSEWGLRASVDTTKAPFGGHIGPVEFRIQGYDKNGHQVADPRTSTIRLYLDNTRPDFFIDEIKLGAQEVGDTPCGVFTLVGEPVPAVMTVRFKAIQEQGFMHSYKLSVRKGNLSTFKISTTSGPLGETSAQLSNTYVHSGTTPCSSLVGTRLQDEIMAVGDYATAYIKPDTGDWLESGQSVCAFAIKLNCQKRVTNGYNDPIRNYGTVEYLVTIKQS